MALKSLSVARLFLIMVHSAVAFGLGANDFPVRQDIEAFHNQTVKTVVSFRIYFPVDDTRYVPVTDKLAAAIALAPIVLDVDNLEIRVLNTTCTPEPITIVENSKIFEAKGGLVKCEVEIMPRESVGMGSHEVILVFTAIDAAFAALEAKVPASSAEARLNVFVWPSVAAKQAEETRRKELQEQEALRQAEEISKARAARRAELMRTAAPWVGVLVLVAIVLFALRHRVRPTASVAIAPGGFVQQREAAGSISADVGQPYGTLVETIWARDVFRRPYPIKVEFLAGASDDATAEDIREHALKVYAHGDIRAEPAPRWKGDGTKLDVLVTVGASVRRGTYIAVGRHGSVKVKVS